MTLRRDARRNRARLLEAAVDVFHRHGAGAPLALVAERAGVGRGTLYRHFPDRAALVATLFEQRVDALERYAVTARGPALLEHLLVEIWWLQTELPGVVTAPTSTPAGRARFDDVAARTRALLDDALALARSGGTVRADVTLDDVYLTIAMVDGAVGTPDQHRAVGTPDQGRTVGAAAGRTGATEPSRVFELALRALRSPDRADLPVPTPRVALAPTSTG